jgi:D-arabinose 1-dehydrogenase
VTAPFYHPSELVLGRALSLLENEFPRNSYTLITKVGKYGAKVREHDYEPATIRASVERSLKRLGTDYLDVVCASSLVPLPRRIRNGNIYGAL